MHAMEPVYIYGTHVVQEALSKRPDVVSVVYAKESLCNDPKFVAKAKRAGELRTLDESRLPEGVPDDALHQGMIARVDFSKLLIPFKTFKQMLGVSSDTSLVVLGEIQDPHNVGAIIRSASAFGVRAVLIPEHRQAPITGTVAKVSVGSIFSVPLVSVVNVNTALHDLKERGFWVYGLDHTGDSPITRESFTKPSVFVVGNEGKGMREKTRAHCDTILTIPMHPRTESLNASVSTAVALYAWSAQHPECINV